MNTWPLYSPYKYSEARFSTPAFHSSSQTFYHSLQRNTSTQTWSVSLGSNLKEDKQTDSLFPSEPDSARVLPCHGWKGQSHPYCRQNCRGWAHTTSSCQVRGSRRDFGCCMNICHDFRKKRRRDFKLLSRERRKKRKGRKGVSQETGGGGRRKRRG